jgi:hypothetical protein
LSLQEDRLVDERDDGSNNNTVADGFVEAFRDCVVKAREITEPLTEREFWTKPYPYGNSCGHLLLHIIGNLNYFIGARIEETGYVRDREREFTEISGGDKAEVLQNVDRAVELVVRSIRNQSVATWSLPYEATAAPEFVRDRFSIVLRCLTHFNHHIGQMLYLQKELRREK